MIEFLDEESPLDYYPRSARARRLALRDTDAPSLSRDMLYFTPTPVPVWADLPGSGRGAKAGQMPGASPGVVAFLDYHLLPDGGIYIDYIHVRPDQRRRGHACQLVDRLYKQLPEASYIDFGEVAHEAVWKLCLRRMGGVKKTRGYFW